MEVDRHSEPDEEGLLVPSAEDLVGKEEHDGDDDGVDQNPLDPLERLGAACVLRGLSILGRPVRPLPISLVRGHQIAHYKCGPMRATRPARSVCDAYALEIEGLEREARRAAGPFGDRDIGDVVEHGVPAHNAPDDRVFRW